jgi:DNA-binding NarL/FixJ family response regulator
MTVLLCSRNDTVRKKWFSALSPTWNVYQAASVDEIVSLLSRMQIDIILLHRSLVDENQLREISTRGAGTKVFVLSDRPEDREGATCLRLGCVGYANTYIAPTRLRSAVQAVQTGLVWVGSSLMQHLIQNIAASRSANPEEVGEQTTNPRIDTLSRREYQIARMVADGKQNNEIAAELEISERTVKAHLSSIYSKTETKGRLNLALLMKKG